MILRVMKNQFFIDFSSSNAGSAAFVFNINLNNDENQRLLGRVYVEGDSLYTWDYPFMAENSPCDDYRNYFLKQ